MIDYFKSTFRRLLENTSSTTFRYLYKTFNLNSRLTGLIGPRGTGKTTLLLQYVKSNITDLNRCLYLSLDHIYFAQMNLMDFVEQLHQIEGIQFLFLDEVHKYPKWDQALKNLYDAYPNLYIVFSGSSSMDLIKGTYDLSRRGKLYRLNGLSFQEYLEFRLGVSIPTATLETLLNKPDKLSRHISGIERLKGHFMEYLEKGFYPFLFEDEENYHQKLLNIIDKTIYEDISNFYKLKTENLKQFRKILSFLATIPPGELNRNGLSKHTGLDNRTVDNYLNMMCDTGLVTLIKENKSGSSILKSTEKIYLENTNLYKAITQEIGFSYQMGTVRELFFIKMLQNAGEKIFYSRVGDFEVGEVVFEIGGRNKTKKQVRESTKPAFLVKDDIQYPGSNTLPLHYFGFLY